MKNLRSYKEFVKINEEEEKGWKDVVLGGAMVASSLIPGKSSASEYGKDANIDKTEISYQKPDSDKSSDIYLFDKDKDKEKERITKVTRSKRDMKYLTKTGWTLDSTHVDTVWRTVTVSKPDTMIYSAEFRLDGAQFFESGKYDLNSEMMLKIDNVFDELYEKGVFITDVLIESSTDKQGLSKNLQNELRSKGYSADNIGLSKARSQSILDYLVETIGINETLIETNELHEMGKGEIDQSARYVTIKIIYLEGSAVVTPDVIEKVPQLKTTYFLSKEKPEYKKGKIIKGKNYKSKPHGPVKSKSRVKAKTECFFKGEYTWKQ